MTVAEIVLALLLARTCVAEIGMQDEATVEECQLMWEVNRRNAERAGRTLEEQTLKFNSFWKVKDRQLLKPWILHMDGPEKPHGWPRVLRWARYKDKWLSCRRAALAFVKSPTDTSYLCVEAINYGAQKEIPKDARQETVYCLGGVTLQRYWRFKR